MSQLDLGAIEPTPGGDCPYGECDGSGFVHDEEARMSRDCRCRPQRQALARARSLSNAIPRRYRGLAFDRHPVTSIAADHPAAVRAVRSYVDGLDEHLAAGRGLWLHGTRGTGKTSLAMLVSQEALRRRRAVAIYSTIDLLNEIRATYDADARQTTAELIDRLAAVDLLHLEDLAVPRPTDWVLEQLYAIVNRRYEDERAILFTSDTRTPLGAGDGGPQAGHGGGLGGPESLAQHVGERTFSRLVEMCGDPVLLFGDDARISVRPAH